MSQCQFWVPLALHEPFFVCVVTPCSMQDLSSLTGNRTHAPLYQKLRVLTTGPPGKSFPPEPVQSATSCLWFGETKKNSYHTFEKLLGFFLTSLPKSPLLGIERLWGNSLFFYWFSPFSHSLVYFGALYEILSTLSSPLNLSFLFSWFPELTVALQMFPLSQTVSLFLSFCFLFVSNMKEALWNAW